MSAGSCAQCPFCAFLCVWMGVHVCLGKDQNREKCQSCCLSQWIIVWLDHIYKYVAPQLDLYIRLFHIIRHLHNSSWVFSGPWMGLHWYPFDDCHLLLEVQLKEMFFAISNVLHKRNPLLRWCIKLLSGSLETQEDVFHVDEVVLNVHDIHWQNQTRLFGKLIWTLDVISDVASTANGVARILLHAELLHFQKKNNLKANASIDVCLFPWQGPPAALWIMSFFAQSKGRNNSMLLRRVIVLHEPGGQWDSWRGQQMMEHRRQLLVSCFPADSHVFPVLTKGVN